MGWQVTSRIYGGRRSSPATLQEYRAMASALEDAGSSMCALASSWSQAAFDLGAERVSAPLCPALSTGTDTGMGLSAEHETLPYAALIAQCRERAEEAEAEGVRLKGLADLLTRAHSLYEQADMRARRTLTELVQAGTQAHPGWASLSMAAIAAGGLGAGWLGEGKPNPAAASYATAPFQEGYLSGIGGKLTRIPDGLGVLLTNEVNMAAGTIGKASAPAKNLLQGDRLEVRRVTTDAHVVRSSTSVAQSLENLRRLAEERLGKIDLDSGLSYATIAVQRYERADGTNAWLVTIPGTDGKYDSPFGWEQNVELMSVDERQRRAADSSRMVVEAMERACIAPDEPVALIGHSQGGIVAAQIAADQSERFDIQHVVTAGSPVANHPIPEKTWVTSIEIDQELVAALDGAENPATDHWLTVRGSVSKAPDETTPTLNEDGSCTPSISSNVRGSSPYAAAPVRDSSGKMELSHWLKYHQAAYRNATDLGSPAVMEHERHFAGVIAGELRETQYYEGRMSHDDLVNPTPEASVQTEPVDR